MSAIVSARVPSILYKALKQACDLKGQRLSSFVREAIEEKLRVEIPDLYNMLRENEADDVFSYEKIEIEEVSIQQREECYRVCDKIEDVLNRFPFHFQWITEHFDIDGYVTHYYDCEAEIPKWLIRVLKKDECIEGKFYCANGHLIVYSLTL